MVGQLSDMRSSFSDKKPFILYKRNVFVSFYKRKVFFLTTEKISFIDKKNMFFFKRIRFSSPLDSV